MVAFTVSPQSGTEGNTLTFRISIQNPNYASVFDYRIYYNTSNGTATAGSDYVGIANQIPVDFTILSPQFVDVPVTTLIDGIAEGTEYFNFNIYDFQHLSLRQVTGTIFRPTTGDVHGRAGERHEGDTLSFQISITSILCRRSRLPDLLRHDERDCDSRQRLPRDQSDRPAFHAELRADRNRECPDVHRWNHRGDGKLQLQSLQQHPNSRLVERAWVPSSTGPPVTFTVAPASGTEGDTLSFQISIHNPYYAGVPDYLIYYDHDERDCDSRQRLPRDQSDRPAFHAELRADRNRECPDAHRWNHRGTENFNFNLYNNTQTLVLASALGTIFDRPPVTFTVAPASGTKATRSPSRSASTIHIMPAFPIT